MAWWRDARFGMFVHWGLYSGLAGNWDGKSRGRNAGWNGSSSSSRPTPTHTPRLPCRSSSRRRGSPKNGRSSPKRPGAGTSSSPPNTTKDSPHNSKFGDYNAGKCSTATSSKRSSKPPALKGSRSVLPLAHRLAPRPIRLHEGQGPPLPTGRKTFTQRPTRSFEVYRLPPWPGRRARVELWTGRHPLVGLQLENFQGDEAWGAPIS